MIRAGRRLRRPLARTGLALGAIAAAAALGGCSAAPTPASLRPIAPGPTPTVTTYTIGTTAWIDGFIVTVPSAVASLDPKGGTLTVNAKLENAGADEATFDAPIVVTAGDTTFQLAHGTTFPDQLPGGTETLGLRFEIVGRGNVDDAVVRIGRAGDHTIAIPLGPAGGPAVTLEPIDQNVSANGKAGTVRLVLHHVQQRWDLPDWHDELPTATRALTITYDVTYTGTFVGGFAFTGDNIQLRLPDQKTLVGPRQDGHSQSIVQIDAGKTARGLTSRFEIPDGLSGSFAVVVDDGSTTRAIPFTIGP